MLRVATRGSPLARWQAEHVIASLGVRGELVVTETEGDRRQDVPIHELGGRGVFAKEVQLAVLDGRADIAVHSAKDLPSTQLAGLTIAAFPPRADARDALVGCRFDELPTGAVVATGSVRRRAQLAAARPDLGFGPLRGNFGTRLQAAERFDAIIRAAAALARLGRAEVLAERLEPAPMCPQVGQGALALECRADDDATRNVLATIDDAVTRRAVEAERAYLAELGGGCDVPCAAHAEVAGDEIRLRARLASLDGHIVLCVSRVGTDPDDVGRSAASDVLDGAGGRSLLAEVAP